MFWFRSSQNEVPPQKEYLQVEGLSLKQNTETLDCQVWSILKHLIYFCYRLL